MLIMLIIYYKKKRVIDMLIQLTGENVVECEIYFFLYKSLS
jgi:hypothetical protein